MATEAIGKYLSVAAYGLAGTLGVIGANYIATVFDPTSVHPYMTAAVGLIVIAIPAFAIHGTAGVEGAARLLLGVAGVTLLARGLLSASGVAIPSQFAGPLL